MIIPTRPREPIKTHFFRAIYRLLGNRNKVDLLLTPLLRHRNYIPVVSAESVIPRFAKSEVTLRDLPRGIWATPLVDTLTVVKAAIGFQSKRILEIGSYKGSTARLIAENSSDDVRIFTLDRDPRHGEAYRGTPLETRITRLIGGCESALLKPHAPFDLIFVDADHDFESVCHHSIEALDVLSPQGIILWHDYQQRDYLHGRTAVPEALHAIAQSTGNTVLSIAGTMLAIHSKYPGWESRRPVPEISIDSLPPDAWGDASLKSD
jgi:predicted O-methyltransferase YrrM